MDPHPVLFLSRSLLGTSDNSDIWHSAFIDTYSKPTSGKFFPQNLETTAKNYLSFFWRSQSRSYPSPTMAWSRRGSLSGNEYDYPLGRLRPGITWLSPGKARSRSASTSANGEDMPTRINSEPGAVTVPGSRVLKRKSHATNEEFPVLLAYEDAKG